MNFLSDSQEDVVDLAYMLIKAPKESSKRGTIGKGFG